MQYMGSKNRIAKYILPEIMKFKTNEKFWIEPFVGGANMIDKVEDMDCVGYDNNEYLIELLNAVKNGWVPPTDISKEFYYEIKNNKGNYDKSLVGFVGFLCSFGCRWWEGYARNNKGRNYADVGSRRISKQALQFKNIVFKHSDYSDILIPNNSLVYCDPPYYTTTKYSNNFNHKEFWDWCSMLNNRGVKVFISEYQSLNPDFICIKSIKHKTTLNKSKSEERTEKIFIHKDLLRLLDD